MHFIQNDVCVFFKVFVRLWTDKLLQQDTSSAVGDPGVLADMVPVEADLVAAYAAQFPSALTAHPLGHADRGNSPRLCHNYVAILFFFDMRVQNVLRYLLSTISKLIHCLTLINV